MADYPAVLRLWKASPRGIGLGASDDPASIRQFLKRNAGLSVVAVKGQQVVGAVLCGHDGRRGYLHHLVVAKRSRGQGIGRAMVEHVLNGLRAEGIPKCNLFLYASNRSGRAFWERMEFTVREDIRLVQRDTKAKP